MRLKPFLPILFVIAVQSIGCSDDEGNPAAPSSSVPVLTTAGVSAISNSSADCGGAVSSDNGATITARGVCWSTSQSPTVSDSKTNDGVGTGSFPSEITGLLSGTTYHVRAYATNSAGTGYGSNISFETLEDIYGSVTDIDGNVYPTVKIGTQWWMAENLKVTHYRNGDAVPHVEGNAEWMTLGTGAYCVYDNANKKVGIYGHLFNWHAVEDNRNIAPSGWHVPNDTEWQTLIEYLGGVAVAGGKMKETGIEHWDSPNTGATNESGFTALPSGYRVLDGHFYDMGSNVHLWLATEHSTTRARDNSLHYGSAGVARNDNDKRYGFSVRCVKD